MEGAAKALEVKELERDFEYTCFTISFYKNGRIYGLVYFVSWVANTLDVNAVVA